MSAARRQRLNSGVVINLGLITIGIGAIVLLLVAQVLQGDEGTSGAPLDLALALEPATSGLESPVLLVGAGDGSGDRYVVEKPGRIVRLLQDGSIAPEPFLDIRDRVLDGHELGLLGLAFHPSYEENGRFYVAYTRKPDDATVLSEFTLPEEPQPAVESEVGEDHLDIEATERPLLLIAQPYRTHKAGMLEFDSEGMLLLSTGDGGSSSDPHDNALDPASLLGKILRLDIDTGWPYAIPTGNGFGAVDGARGEVHAIGLRNPWRFALDRHSGDIYVADVGQSSWEEINILRRGEREVSFGWDQLEGEACVDGQACEPSQHREPALAYSHVDGDVGHCAIVGGYVYRGSNATLPDGAYIYADYCSGTIWAVPAADLLAGNAQPAEVGRLEPERGQIQGFGQDDAGELYLLTSAGDVFHLREATDAA